MAYNVVAYPTRRSYAVCRRPIAGKLSCVIVKPIKRRKFMMQEVKIQTGTSFHGNKDLRDFISFLITHNFSVNAEKGEGGIIVTASRWLEGGNKTV